MPFFLIVLGLWVAWAVSWFAAALWADRAQKRLALGAELWHRLPLVLGYLLLMKPAHGYEGPLRLWHVGYAGAWACVATVAAGFAFCWWARLHLGRLWSASITKKENHRIVDSGPYGYVRHPIYTGLYISTLGTVLIKGTVLGLAGGVLVMLSFYWKARLEERWLRDELGAEVYDAYARRVPMLIPFWPAG